MTDENKQADLALLNKQAEQVSVPFAQAAEQAMVEQGIPPGVVLLALIKATAATAVSVEPEDSPGSAMQVVPTSIMAELIATQGRKDAMIAQQKAEADAEAEAELTTPEGGCCDDPDCPGRESEA